jgi:RluA family pseudouridine synthase
MIYKITRQVIDPVHRAVYHYIVLKIWHSAHAFDSELDRDITIPIVYQDRHFLIVNKPAEINITNRQKDVIGRRQTVESVLMLNYGRGLRNAHQLDYATSGIFCWARSAKSAADMSLMFAERRVRKTYAALVRGHVATETMVITAAVGEHPKVIGQMAVEGSNAKSASTELQVMKQGYLGDLPVTLVRLHPHTGRTHQLRVHMQHIGHPIVGDFHYEQPLTPSYRMFLHAWKIEFHFDQLKQASMPHWNALWRRYVELHQSRRSQQKGFTWLEGLRALSAAWVKYANAVQSSSVHVKPLLLSTEIPFMNDITNEPQSSPPFPDLMAFRMSRHAYAQENIDVRYRNEE